MPNNDAAEHLRELWNDSFSKANLLKWQHVEDALTAERRATVEEINRLIGERNARTYEEVAAILDEVAAR